MPKARGNSGSILLSGGIPCRLRGKPHHPQQGLWAAVGDVVEHHQAGVAGGNGMIVRGSPPPPEHRDHLPGLDHPGCGDPAAGDPGLVSAPWHQPVAMADAPVTAGAVTVPELVLGWGEVALGSAVSSQPGVKVGRPREIEQGFCQGLQLLQRQRLDASGGGGAQSAAAACQ